MNEDENEPRRCQRQRAQPVKYDVQFETTLKMKKRKLKQKTKENDKREDQDDEDGKQKKRSKRTKERLVHEIIEKVSTWRSLYNGIMIPSEIDPSIKVEKKWSLEEAAIEVGITKKSLDDYLLQLRFGRKFGYDFEANKLSKVGELRHFVKKEKNKLRERTGKRKISSKYDENEEEEILEK